MKKLKYDLIFPLMVKLVLPIVWALFLSSCPFVASVAAGEVLPKKQINPKNKPAEVLSKVVGKVAKHFVTSREVQLNYLIEGVLTKTKSEFLQTPKLLIGSNEFQRELNGSFLEWMVDLESKEFSITDIPAAEYGKALKIINERLPQHSSWSRILADGGEVRAALGRKLRAKKFIRFKVESSVVGITDQEAKNYYERNEGKFGQNSFVQFKENIKTFLKRKKMNDRLQDWFEVLQKKYTVQSFVVVQKGSEKK